MINCHLSIILVADSRKKNRTSIVVLTKKKNFRELQALEWAENAHFGSEKRETEKNERSVFRVIFPRVKICKFSFSYYKDQRKSGRLRHFTNVGLFFLSIPIPGFVPSDRFAWNGPVRLSFTDRRNSSQARQTPPVGRSENLTGPSFLLQWSSATKPCIFRQHYRAKKESFIE